MKASDVENVQLARATAAAAHDPLFVPAAGGRRALDLGRDVHALLGLVFDRIDLSSAVTHVRRCAQEGRPCFLSTPNVNFVVAATREASFRGSVLRSDLSVADGFPIVLVARWMGIELPGRVAGADVFEGLQAQGRSDARPPIRLFLFGGPPGVGAQAAARINAQAGGFECVGHDEGGWGDIEAMSSPATIERINASRPDFVLVALGAKKGQAWIEHNRVRLNAPVISHLGAVINFAAASVSRSPRWMQRMGLEWAWRIVQEPQLWRRYWDDGRVLCLALLTQVLPWRLRRILGRLPAGAGGAAAFSLEAAGQRVLRVRLVGDWRNAAETTSLRSALADALRNGQAVQFDLGAAPVLGSAVLGLLCVLDAWQVQPRAVCTSTVEDPVLRADIRAYGAQHLLDERTANGGDA